MLSDLIGGYLTLDLNQPIEWADFQLDALLADRMSTKFYTTGPMSKFYTTGPMSKFYTTGPMYIFLQGCCTKYFSCF
jgi:hypothetical protein